MGSPYNVVLRNVLFTESWPQTGSEVCKLRIDYDTLVLEGPYGISATAATTDGPRVTDCGYDTLTVTNPGGATPPGRRKYQKYKFI